MRQIIRIRKIEMLSSEHTFYHYFALCVEFLLKKENEELEKQKKLAQEKIEAITDALDDLGKNNAYNIFNSNKHISKTITSMTQNSK